MIQPDVELVADALQEGDEASQPPRPRAGWAEQFAREGPAENLFAGAVGLTKWDEEEWEW